MQQKKNTLVKVSPPRLSSVLHRTRLFNLLDRARSQPVIWVSGLPGSGKTTLAADYVEANAIPSAWYQIDGTDNDPAGFFLYMTEAVSRGDHAGTTDLPALSPEHFMNLPCYAIQYFRALFKRIKKPFVLVLDDYHELSPDSALHELIRAGMEQAPPGLNILVLSRSAPPPAMSRLLMHKTIINVQPGELCLTPEEARGIARLHTDRKSILDSVPMLLEYSGGWTAGFVLMLEYDYPDRAAPPEHKAMAREFFFNYFAGEIFNKLEPDIQTFLLTISCLPPFTPADAQKLTGFARTEQVLADMAGTNSFIEKKALPGTSYRFHPLFREFLLSRAEEEFTAGQSTELYRRAAALLVERGQPEDAFLLYVKCNDPPALAGFIREHAQAFLFQGRLKVVEKWLQALPPPLLDADPWFLFQYGQCCLPFDPRKSRNFFIRAHDHFRKRNETTGIILSISCTLETILTEWGDFKQMDPWITELDTLIRNRKFGSPGKIEGQAVLALFSALMFRQPHHPDLKRLGGRLFELLRSDLNINLRLLMGGYLSHYLFWTGDFLQCSTVINILVELMKSDNISPLPFMVVKIQEAVHRWHAAEHEECMEAMEQGLAEAERSGVHLIDNWLLAQGVYAMLAIDDREKAAVLLYRMRPILNSRRSLDIGHFYYLSSLHAFQNSDREHALQYIEEAQRYILDTGTPLPEGLTAITAAQIYFEAGDAEKAEEYNSRAGEIGHGMESHLLLLLSSLNKAYFSLKTGRQGDAEKALRTALAIQKDRGLVNFAGWQTLFMRDLYTEALRSGIEVDFVRDIIRKRGLYPESSSLEVANWPWRVEIRTMGRFEAVIDGTPLRFSGKPPLKPLNMLKALIALGGSQVGAGRLENLLWPEADGDRARQALVTTLHRLRKIVGYDEALKLSEMRLSLDRRYCWVDVWAIDSLFTEIEKSLAADRPDADTITRLTEKLLGLYRGDFLGNEDECPWAYPTRARLRSRFLHTIGMVAGHLEKRGAHAGAVALYLRGLEVDETAERLYRGLMKCHLARGRTAEGLAVYERCRNNLSAALHTVPSPATESIHRALRRGKSQG